MDLIIYGLVGVVALAVIFEALKRSSAQSGSHTAAASEEEGPYLSADEIGPTETGRMRAIQIKKAIHGGPQDQTAKAPAASGLRQPAPPEKDKRTPGGAHASIDHEKVESTESGGFELPDPFSLELNEDSKE